MNAHDILKQKLLDTEEDHTTGITREEVLCIQSKLESLHKELVEAVNNKTHWKSFSEKALSSAETLYLFWEEGFGTAGAASEKYFETVKEYKQTGGMFAYAPDY